MANDNRNETTRPINNADLKRVAGGGPAAILGKGLPLGPKPVALDEKDVAKLSGGGPAVISGKAVPLDAKADVLDEKK